MEINALPFLSLGVDGVGSGGRYVHVCLALKIPVYLYRYNYATSTTTSTTSLRSIQAAYRYGYILSVVRCELTDGSSLIAYTL